MISTKTTHIVDTKKNFTISDSRKYKLMRLVFLLQPVLYSIVEQEARFEGT